MSAKRVLKWSALITTAVLLACATLIGVAWWRASRVPDWYVEARKVSANAADENHVIPARNWLAGASSGQVDAKPPEQKRQAIQLSAEQINALIAKWTGNIQSSLQDVRVRITPKNITVAGYVKQQEKVVSVVLRPETGPDGTLRITLESIRVGNQGVPSVMVPEDMREKAIAVMSGATPDRVRIDEYSRATREASNVYAAVSMLELLRGESIEPYAFVELPFEKAIVAARVRDVRLADGHADLTLELLGPEERQALVQRLRDALAPAGASQQP